ncbi:MAG: hypothetical protein FH758_00145 [Firmicutes bacterium]|nr:hypothetical protein [Bacillota bacterium]
MLKIRNRLIVGLLVILIAGLLSNFASSHPDGLEQVAEDLGFINQATGHTSIFYDYSLPGTPAGLTSSLAGILGSALVFVLVYGLSSIIRKV